MNFIKGSLFRRNTEPEELEPVVESGGGVLAVWGSPGCGKTVTAVKIAKHLASQKKNVALLLCDMTAPMMPCICPPSELECDKSLGSIFAAQRISVNLIKHNLTTHKKLSYLTILGLRKGENEYTYAACTKQQAEELIRGLREIAPYVVIDCSSYIANDILSAVALMEADSVLRLANCDLKSIGYLSSQLPLLRELHWDEDKQYKAASNIKPLQAADRIGQVLGSVAFKLPYPEAVTMLLGGEVGTIYPSAAERVVEPPKPFVLPPVHSDMRRVYAYLVKHRNIDRSVVAHFARERLLYEDAKYHNAVFVGTDEEGVPRHAHKRSTNSYGKAFRLNVEGCNPRYSFHHMGTDESLYVFEAPIDMLSYITLHPEDWQRHSYVACCGTSIQPVAKMLERMPQIHTVLLCLDNDEAGHLANQRMMAQLEADYTVERLVPENKDWNDDLTTVREQKCEVNTLCQSFG